MRLYKDVKVELKASTKITIKGIAKCTAKIKKYAGETKIVSIDGRVDYEKREKDLKFMEDYQLSIDSNDIDIIDIKYNTEDPDITKSNFKEIDRSNATLNINYIKSYDYNIVLQVYGRLFIGNGPNFEDCFETRSGFKLDEIIDDKKITNYIKSRLTDIMNYEITVTHKYDDNVRLLPNNDEFVDAIYENASDIMSAIDDDFHYRMHGNPLEE